MFGEMIVRQAPQFDASRFAFLVRDALTKEPAGVHFAISIEAFVASTGAYRPARQYEFSLLPHEAVAEGDDWFVRTFQRAADNPWVSVATDLLTCPATAVPSPSAPAAPCPSPEMGEGN